MPRAKYDSFHRSNSERARIRKAIASMIDGDNRKRPPAKLPKQKWPTRWRAGVCRICGERFDFVAHAHAQRHGFKDAEEMVRADVITWIE